MADGKIISIWGSPHSGKTTLAVKLATKLYDNLKPSIIVVFADYLVPPLPSALGILDTDIGSIGNVVTSTEDSDETIIKNVVVSKTRSNLAFIGFKLGENIKTYPKYTKEMAKKFLLHLKEMADYVIVDCMSDVFNSSLTEASLEIANYSYIIASPDSSAITFFSSMLPIVNIPGEKVHVLNVNENDVFTPIEEIEDYFDGTDVIIPFCLNVKEQKQECKLEAKINEKNFNNAIAALVNKGGILW